MACTFCYTSIPNTTVHFSCHGCGDAYCSPACLRQDWKTHHAPWCGVDYGRKGRDWIIQHISSTKGDGVVALRDFRDGERIMVERMLDGDIAADPAFGAFMELGPKESSDPLEKYKINAIGSNDHRGVFGGIFVNMSKVNHACEPNSFTHYEPKSNTMALIAIGSIPAGAEITASYTDVLNPDTCGSKSDLQIHRTILSTQYGIVCDPTCACRDAKVMRKVKQSRALDKIAQQQFKDGNFDDAYASYKARLDASMGLKVRRGICFDLFNLCNVTGRADEAKIAINEAHEITCMMSHARSPEARMYSAIAEKSEIGTLYLLKEHRPNTP